jgi:hypothetical protein
MRSSNKWIVSLFDRTGVMVAPWVASGYRAVCVDARHEGTFEREGVRYVGADMLDWVPHRDIAVQGVAFVAAFPPCDHLAVSGSRWFRGKGLGKLAASIRLFERAAFWCEWFGAPYLIENPVSTISSYWRKPDHTFHPWQFSGYEPADCYVKKTCLWTGNGFVMPEPFHAPDVVPDDRIHKMPPSEDRADRRSMTPRGFAEAVYAANCRDRSSEP